MIIHITDYRLAGFLSSRGQEMVGTSRSGRQVEFQFEDGEAVRALMDQYPGSPECRYDRACKAMNALARTRISGGR
jgi:hypothetical protein